MLLPGLGKRSVQVSWWGMYIRFLDFFFIFRNVLVGGYILGICSRSSHKDIDIRHLLTSNQGSNHIGPRLPVMGVYAMYICSSVPILF